MTRRVVITGLGTVNPLGLTFEAFWNNLAQGKSGIVPLTHFDASTMGTRFGGQVPECDFLPLIKDQKMARRLDRAIVLATVAAQQAWKDSGLEDGAPGGRVTGSVHVPDVSRFISPPSAGTVQTCVGGSDVEVRK